MKSGTTKAAGSAAIAASRSGVRNGPGNKNVVSHAKRMGRPHAPTAPLKGPDKGGV